MSFSLGQLLVCGVLNLGMGLAFERGIAITGPFLFAVAYTAFFALGLCYTLQIWAQKHTPPADAALILSLESVFSVISGWLLLDERLATIQILGCILIFAAVLLSQFKDWNLRGTPRSPLSSTMNSERGTIDYDHLIEGR
jgi:drug/metabolite transporter (DMT)-like permease